MSVEIEKLLVIKAFRLGNKIVENKSGNFHAINLIDVAINQLKEMNDEVSQVRLMFYLLLKSESMRGTDESIKLRKIAQELSIELNSNIYTYYMALEDATQDRKRAHGFKMVIADRGVQTLGKLVLNSSEGYFFHDIAYDVFGINPENITDKEQHFIDSISLKELLEFHNINF